MRVGTGLVSMGVLLAAMSVATLGLGLPRVERDEETPLPRELGVALAWTLACLPYPQAQTAPVSPLSAYACR